MTSSVCMNSMFFSRYETKVKTSLMECNTIDIRAMNVQQWNPISLIRSSLSPIRVSIKILLTLNIAYNSTNATNKNKVNKLKT